MDYGAISIDTSIFDQMGLKLESGLLKTLEQFKGKPSHIVLSEIVAREVHAHLTKKSIESRNHVTKAIRESISNLSISEANSEMARNLLLPEDSDNEVAKKRINNFIDNTGAEIVFATKGVSIDEIIKKYFKSEPPFSESGKKKNEFPDAIALISLESWAKENKTKILAVSKDKDWGNFGEISDYIDVIEDLAEAIAKFQPHSAAIDFSILLSKELPHNKPVELYDLISQYLSDSVSELDIYPDASSQFFYEHDYVEVILDDFDFITDSEGNALLQPIQGQDTTLIVETKVNITATASASFSLSARDSIDKDYLSIGNASANTDFQFQSEILLSQP